MAAPVFEDVSDDELARVVHDRGDAQAFGRLYERHSQGVYDFIYRIVRDPDLAADVTQDTFAGAWTNLQKREVSGNVRAWLFTIARNRAINEIRRSRRFFSRREQDQGDDPLLYTVDTSRLSDPEKMAVDQEMAELVWTSASALKPREYSLLDLHVRRGLSPEEIAAETGASRKNIHVNLFRLRRSMEQSVSGLLMMRRGRQECPELNAILSQAATDELTPRLRRLVSKHVDRCGRCGDLRRRLVSPVEIFASLVLIPLPEETRTVIWHGIVLTAAAGGAGVGALAGVAHGPLGWLAGKATSVQGAMVAGGAVVAGVVVGVVVLITSNGGGAAPRDPDDVHSSTHEVGKLSSSNVIDIAWSRQPNAAGYSIEWSPGDIRLPDDRADLPGDAVGTRSGPLPDGRWYFNLRTQSPNQRWTSTVHLGPFIVGPAAVSVPVGPAASPSPAPVLTPAVAGALASPAPEAPPSQSRPGQNAAPAVNPAELPLNAVPPAATPAPVPTPTPAPALSVKIDVRPGSEKNVIKLDEDEVPVALFTSPTFDAARADRASIRFAGAAATGFELKDVDRDGRMDVLLEFRAEQMALTTADKIGCLTGRTIDGQSFQGCDNILVTAHSSEGRDESGTTGDALWLGGSLACFAALVIVRKPRR